MIVCKIIFGSNQDIKDAKSILTRQYENLDFNYIETLCKKFGVIKKWRKIKEEVESVLRELT